MGHARANIAPLHVALVADPNPRVTRRSRGLFPAMVTTSTLPRSALVVVVDVVVFTLNGSFYPTTSAVSPVTFLILHRREENPTSLVKVGKSSASVPGTRAQQKKQTPEIVVRFTLGTYPYYSGEHTRWYADVIWLFDNIFVFVTYFSST